MSDAANTALARRWHAELFVQGNLAVAEEILSSDFTMHAPGVPPEWRGPEGAKQFVRLIRGAFSDIELPAEDLIAAGDRVVDRWSLRGVHTGPFGDLPATGKRFAVTGIDIFRIADGKLAEFWQNWDQLGLLQQLGALPAPAPRPGA